MKLFPYIIMPVEVVCWYSNELNNIHRCMEIKCSSRHQNASLIKWKFLPLSSLSLRRRYVHFFFFLYRSDGGRARACVRENDKTVGVVVKKKKTELVLSTVDAEKSFIYS